MTTTTIAAPATPPGEGGIAVIRLSGPAALAIADRVADLRQGTLTDTPAGRFRIGAVVRPDSRERIDEAVFLVYRAPHSYTREDVVEIQCHGGRAVTRAVFDAVLDAGALPAEPGEFTKRAFLNGRIDLTQAEAVMDAVHAQSEQAAHLAIEQMQGTLRRTLESLYESVIGVAAGLEVSLDFAEQELPEAAFVELADQLNTAQHTIRTLLATWTSGHLLREGAHIALCGRPNVGKSTLMNALTGTDRAIVTEIAGTTRDIIEETIVAEGVLLRLIDTAGLRDTACPVERIGIDRARASMQRADLVVWVIDAAAPLTPEEHDFLAERDPRRCIVVLNKCDLGIAVETEALAAFTCVQARHDDPDSAPRLRDAILQKLLPEGLILQQAAVSSRHRQLLDNAHRAVAEALELLAVNAEENAALAASALRDALEALGSITGRTYTDDLLATVFSRFCIGK